MMSSPKQMRSHAHLTMHEKVISFAEARHLLLEAVETVFAVARKRTQARKQ